MAKNQHKVHAIMIPYPFQGHVIPFVNLAMKLASKGFTITFVNTHSVHQQISQAQTNLSGTARDIFDEARKSGLDIRYATVSDGLPLDLDRSLHHDQHQESLLQASGSHVDELIGKIVAENADPPVTCLIADTFFVWPSLIANKYNLVYVSFWTEPALVFTLYYHLDLLKQNGHFASKDNRRDTIDYIPGVEAIEPRDLMSYLQATDITTVLHRIIDKAFTDVKRADFVICNTVQELEQDTLTALNQKQPVYAIGPILANDFAKTKIAMSLWSESDCSQWLNTKANGSVLYVSFGSYAHVSKHDIVEIAHGLLLSGVNFVWVLRPDIVSSDDTDILPEGFIENARDKGLVVPWCHQIAVLSHPAIGGFLTHCGWNSIMESIWCGIPLICFPILTDQFTNRKLVVHDWKLGINLCDEKMISREQVSANIASLMSGEILNIKLMNKMKQVKKTLENATDGSSNKNFEDFISAVKANIVSR